MLKDNLKIKMHTEKSGGTFKCHYADVLKGLLKRILNEKKQDYKVRGALEKKLNNMWNKKQKTTTKPKRLKSTAAHLAAVRIIENWFFDIKNFGNLADAKVISKGETDKFKDAQR